MLQQCIGDKGLWIGCLPLSFLHKEPSAEGSLGTDDLDHKYYLLMVLKQKSFCE